MSKIKICSDSNIERDMIMKLNINRKKIIQFIKNYKIPVSSKEIAGQFNDEMDQATVYRNLLYLNENNYIESFKYFCQIAGAVTYYYMKNDTHNHFLHCSKCHTFQAIEECNRRRIKKLEEANKIKIYSHTNYYTGLCSNCNL